MFYITLLKYSFFNMNWTALVQSHANLRLLQIMHLASLTNYVSFTETQKTYQPSVVEDPNVCAPLWRAAMESRRSSNTSVCMLTVNQVQLSCVSFSGRSSVWFSPLLISQETSILVTLWPSPSKMPFVDGMFIPDWKSSAPFLLMSFALGSLVNYP